MTHEIKFSTPAELFELFETAADHARTPYNQGFVRYVADKFIEAGLATKEEYRLWANDGRGGFLPCRSYFPSGSGAALTSEAKDMLLPKPQKPRMSA